MPSSLCNRAKFKLPLFINNLDNITAGISLFGGLIFTIIVAIAI